jgi:hypothetical protein
MKSHWSRYLVPGLFALLLSFSACDLPPVDEGNVIHITSNVEDVTTWSTGHVYLIEAWDFYVENTLTIQPGVIVKFHSSLGPYMVLGGSGTIIANGTADSPIIFTSDKDDANGGDTNGDGSATSPARRDWLDIDTNGLNGSVFNYCKFFYGGGGSYTTTLALSAGSDNVSVTNCTFAHNDGSDVSGWYGALDASSGGAACVIQNNAFYDNIRPLSISTNFNMDDSNTFHNPDNAADTNDYNGIFVETYDFTHDLSWGETEVAFVIDDNDWWISDTGSLTLANNVVLKFRPTSCLVLGDSAPVNNHGGAGVAFTSYKDDTRKGDTNGDGGATTPADNDWGGIYDDVAVTYVAWANIYHDSH